MLGVELPLREHSIWRSLFKHIEVWKLSEDTFPVNTLTRWFCSGP